MKNETATIALIEDNMDCALALESLLQSVKLKTLRYDSAEAFLERIHDADCIIADVRLPGMSGLQLQGELNKKNCVIPYIVISGHANIDMAVRAMKAGAADFFTKPIDNQNLLDCIFRVVRDSRTAAALRQQQDQFEQRVATLTTRERQVLGYVAKGLLSKVIANKLVVSKNTIDVHRVSILRKLEVDSVAQLIAQAGRYGLVTTEEDGD